MQNFAQKYRHTLYLRYTYLWPDSHMEHGINLFWRELVGVKHIIELKEETEKLQNTVNLQLNDNNNIIPVFRLKACKHIAKIQMEVIQ